MAQARGLAAQARSSRFKLDHAMEDVRNQIELLKSNVAQLKVEEANRLLAERTTPAATSSLKRAPSASSSLTNTRPHWKWRSTA